MSSTNLDFTLPIDKSSNLQCRYFIVSKPFLVYNFRVACDLYVKGLGVLGFHDKSLGVLGFCGKCLGIVLSGYSVYM